jgi:hypothetical protein
MPNLFYARSGQALFATLSLGLLAGCQQPTDGPTLVEGQVIEHTGRQPVGGATVQVWQAGKAGGYTPVGQGQATDAQGRFRFRFEADSKTGYLVLATAPPGYLTDWGLAPSLTAGRRNKDLLVPMYAPAWVKLVLVDEPPKSRVAMTITGYSGGGESLRYPRDTVLIRPIMANLTKSVTCFIYELGQDRKVTYSFQATPLDTVTVRIPF